MSHQSEQPKQLAIALFDLPPVSHELPMNPLAILEASHIDVRDFQGKHMTTTPFASSRLAKFIDKRIGELHLKTQADIAREAGFKNANFITMLKQGNAKLALDRVPALAEALDTDPSHLMRLALEQTFGAKMMRVFTDLLGEPVTTNEKAWLELIREGSGNTDPAPTPLCVSMIKLVLRHER
jgi:hypothetical protein